MSDVLRGIGRRKFMVLACLLAGLLAGGLVLALLKPSYQSEAQVIIENLATPFEKVNSVQIEQRSEPVDQRVVASQVSVIKSGDMGARVVDSLNLSTFPEFNSLLKSPSAIKSILIATGFVDNPQLLTTIQLALKQLDSRLTVYPTPESNIIGIKYQSSDPQLSADVANAIADTYVLSTRETAAGSTSRARDWLQQQITELRTKVSTAENAVENYRSEAGLLTGEKSTLGTQQISELNSQITLAEAASSEAAARADEIRNLLAQKGSVDASSDVLSSALIQNLREQQSTASRKLSELSAVYLPNHPKMVAAQQELASINRNIRSEANKIIDSLIGQAKIAAARAQSLRTSLDKLKGTQATANLSDVKLQELERDAQASRVLLEQMLGRYADVSSRRDLSLQPGFARVIQKAVPLPSNYFPKAGPILALTGFGGLAFGLGLAFLFSVMSASATVQNNFIPEPDTVETQDALPDEISSPAMDVAWPVAHIAEEIKPKVAVVPTPPSEKILAVLSTMPSASNLAATLALVESTYSGTPTAITESATRIAMSLSTLNGIQGLKSIALTSIGGRGMDASLATIAITRTLAAGKRKVIAVDLSSMNSPFETMFEVPAGCGISDLVAGEADFTKVICRDPHSSAHVIRFGLKTAQHVQAALPLKLAPIMKALTGIYDFVLVHVGEATPATPALVKECMGTMILAPQTRYKDAAAASRMLEQQGMACTMFVRLDPENDGAAKHAASA